MRLLNKIALEKLNYLKTTQAIYYLNINRPPTAFIADMPPLGLTRDVYIYYTNIKNVDQTYVIRPGSLAGAYLTGTHAEIHCVDGLQLYSGSGKGAVYDINDAYDDCNPSGYPNQFEIQGERPPYIDYSECPEPLPAGAMCVTVPAFPVVILYFHIILICDWSKVIICMKCIQIRQIPLSLLKSLCYASRGKSNFGSKHSQHDRRNY